MITPLTDLRRLGALLLIALAWTAHAQPAAETAQAEDVPTYTIELVVFEPTGADTGAEYWHPAATPDTAGAWEPGRAPVSPLGPGGYTLQAVADTLERAGGYRVILHTGWQQPAYADERARAVQLIDPRERLLGTVTLERGLYLHLGVDLLYRPGTRTGDRPAAGMRPGDMVVETPRGWRLHEHRRVRLEELHYFDHPRFGVIAAVRTE